MYRKHGLAYVFTRDFWLYDFKKDLENMGKTLKNLVKSIKNLEIALNFDQENEWQPCHYAMHYRESKVYGKSKQTYFRRWKKL